MPSPARSSSAAARGTTGAYTFGFDPNALTSTLTVRGNLYSGYEGVGNFAQSSGTVSVGGYLRSGAMTVNAGTVTTPKVKLGVTAGLTGTYTQAGGTNTVGTFGVGNDATQGGGAGIGVAGVSGGTLTATTLLIGSTAGGNGAFTWSGGELNVTNARLAGTAKLAVAAAGPTRTLAVKELSVAGPGAVVDLGDNVLLIDYTDADPTAGVRSLLLAGRNGGAWNGASGLASATAAGTAGAGDALGYARAGELFDTFPRTYAGETIDATTLIVRYTLAGDADLDGGVIINDFNALAGRFGQSGSQGWVNGDFDYDGGGSGVGRAAGVRRGARRSGRVRGDHRRAGAGRPRAGVGGVDARPAAVGPTAVRRTRRVIPSRTLPAGRRSARRSSPP